MDYELKDFQADVLEASRTQPVVVDLWAEWCGPCRTLGPILEKLAGAANGAWKLVKINVDLHPQVAQMFQAKSIPAVKMVVDGALVDEFTGALPEKSIVEWLARHIKAAPAPTGGIAEAEALLEAGDTAGAEPILAALVQADPENVDARVLLAGALVWAQPQRALDLVEGVGADARHYDVAQAVRTAARLLVLDLATLPADPARADYVAALAALRTGDFDTAAGHLIAAVEANRSFDEDGPRLACIALFKLLGRGHAVTQDYRRRFNMALH